MASSSEDYNFQGGLSFPSGGGGSGGNLHGNSNFSNATPVNIFDSGSGLGSKLSLHASGMKLPSGTTGIGSISKNTNINIRKPNVSDY